MDLDYLHRLLLATEAHLVGRVWCYATRNELVLGLERDGRTMHQPLTDPVYHLHPDGLDVEEQAEWLAELFNEEAR